MSKKKNKGKRFDSTTTSTIAKSELPTSDIDNAISAYELMQYLGPRNQREISNGEIVNTRFRLKSKCVAGSVKDFNVYKADNTYIGQCARIPLDSVWNKVSHFLADSTCTKPYASASDDTVAKKYDLTKKEWENAKDVLVKYIKKNNLTFHGDKHFDGKGELPIFVQDVLHISELEFLQLFLNKASKVIDLLETAIQADVVETAALEKRWKKIKRYAYKVDLLTQEKAVFKERDAENLNKHGIRFLNDIRKYSVLDIKNMFLNRDIKQLPEEINAAFKEDYERRLDIRLKVWPLTLGLIALAATFAIGIVFQYTLLKNITMTLAIIGLLFLWAICVGLIIYAAARARRRRRTKRPDYYYLSKKTARTFIVFLLMSFCTITSTTVFYERYDGYDDHVYYRNLGNGQISIAGLVSKEMSVLSIPRTIDGKTTVRIAPAAFYGSQLQQVSMPYTVASSGSSAFQNSKLLQSVEISPNIEDIPRNMFSGCTSLTLVNNADKATEVQTIGNGAFANCTLLEKVEFPNVAEVGDRAFDGCSQFNSFAFGKVTSIGDKAFKNTALQSVTLSKNLTDIGKNAFSGCSLKTLTLPFLGGSADNPQKLSYFCKDVQSVTVLDASVICDDAFANSANLQSVELYANGGAFVGKGAFDGCENLRSVVLPNGITFCSDRMFKNCKLLSYVSGINNVTYVGDEAFYNCNVLNVDEMLKRVNTIGNRAFYGCKMLNEFDMSNIGSLGTGAFASSGLKSVVIGNSLTVLPAETFKDCTLLQSVTGYSNVERIEADVFNGCSALSQFTIAPKINYIGDGAFANCTKLESMVVPSTVNELGKGIFDNCSSLSQLRIPFVGKTMDTSSKYSFTYLMAASNDTRQSIKLTVTEMDTVYAKTFNGCSHISEVNFTKSIQKIENGAFKNATNLKSIDVKGLTEIGKDTFSGCTSLETVLNAESIETIGKNAFYNCTTLASLKLENIVTLEDGAFRNCESIRTVRFTTPLKTIGNNVFRGCINLSEASIGSSVEKIGKNVFYDCSALTDLTLPYLGSSVNKPQKFSYFCNGYGAVENLVVLDVAKVPNSAFSGFNSLKNVTLSHNGSIELGKYAFENCFSLQRVQLPSGITEYPKGLFKNCSKLTYVSDFDKVTSVGDYAFSGCSSFEHGTNLSNLKSIGKRAFSNCSSLTEINLRSVEQLGNDAFSSCVNLTDVYIGNFIDAIPDGCFDDCRKLSNLYGGSSVTKIGNKSFRGCAFSGEFSLANRIVSIGAYAFADNGAITSFTIPASVDKMGRGILEDCNGLTSITTPFIGKTRSSAWAYTFKYLKPSSYFYSYSEAEYTVYITDMNRIHSNSFKGATKMVAVVLSDEVKHISDGAFRNSNIRYVQLPSSITQINNVFRNCEDLTSVVGGDGIEKLGFKAFYNCYSLQSVSFSNVKKVSARCFENCTRLQTVFLPSLETIGNRAFYDCDSFDHIDLSRNLKTIGNKAFYNCTALHQIAIPDSVTKIGEEAFRDSGLTLVSFGKGLTEIGDDAFRNTSLVNVTLNSGLEKMGKNVFRDCSNLQTATLPNSLEKIGNRCFYGCSSLRRLSVPFIGRTQKSASRLNYLVDDFYRRHDHAMMGVTITNAKTIANGAFKNCKYLTYVVFNSGIEKMGIGIFNRCTNLKAVALPSSLSEYRHLIPSGVTIFSDGSFINNFYGKV